MPKVPICEQCDEMVDEEMEEYVDVSERVHIPPGRDHVALVHADCYKDWKAGHKAKT